MDDRRQLVHALKDDRCQLVSVAILDAVDNIEIFIFVHKSGQSSTYRMCYIKIETCGGASMDLIHGLIRTS